MRKRNAVSVWFLSEWTDTYGYLSHKDDPIWMWMISFVKAWCFDPKSSKVTQNQPSRAWQVQEKPSPNSPWTVSWTTLLMPDPTALVAWHKYCPWSVNVSSRMINVPFSSVWMCELLMTGWYECLCEMDAEEDRTEFERPLASDVEEKAEEGRNSHQVRAGGYPLAWQWRSKSWPRMASASEGTWTHLGGTAMVMRQTTNLIKVFKLKLILKSLNVCF